MNAVKRLRRTPRLIIVAAVVAALSIVAVAYAATPAIQTITPNSADQMTNIDVARQQAKNYYGAPLAASGASGTWADPLNVQSNYAHEAESVASKGESWLHARSKVPNRAIVLDVDDTTLTTWNYELFSNWDFNPGTNANFVGLTGSTFTGNMFPATPGMVDMVSQAKAMGYAIFWITGRGDSQHGDDRQPGERYRGRILGHPLGDLFRDTVPEIDAGYVMPTPLDIGHGGFTDGLFTKPSVGSYPAYLNQPQFCADAITNGARARRSSTSPARARTSSRRLRHRRRLRRPVQRPDGGFADKTFKMPNPNYFLP